MRRTSGSPLASSQASAPAMTRGQRIVGRRGDGVDQSAGEVDLDRLDHRREQVGLVGELVVERAARDTGGVGDALGADLAYPCSANSLRAAATSAARVAAVRSAWRRRVTTTLTSVQSVCNLQTRCT